MNTRTPHFLSFLLFMAFCVLALAQIAGCGRDPAANLRAASDALLSAVNNFEQGRYEQALNIGREALYAQRMIGNDSLCAETCLLLGQIYFRYSELDSSEQSYRTGIQYAEAASDRRLRVRNVVGLSGLLSDLGRNREALVLAGEALPLARFSADTISMFRSLDILMRAHRDNGDAPEALRLLGQMILLDSVAFLQRGETELRAQELKLLAGFKTLEEVRTTYTRLVKRFSLRNDQLALAKLHGAWAHVELGAGQTDSAYRTLTQILASNALNDDQSLRRSILIQLGTLQYRRGNDDDARRFYLDALRCMTDARDIPARSLLGLQIVACDWKLRSARGLPVTDELFKACSALKDSASAVGFRPGEAFGLFLSGRLHLSGNDTTAAWNAFLAARERYSVNGNSFLPAELGGVLASFFEREGGSWFQTPLDLACLTGRADTAFMLEEESAQDGISAFFRNLPLRNSNADLEARIKSLQESRQKFTLFERGIAECTSILNAPREEHRARREHIVISRNAELVGAATSVSALSPSLGYLFSSGVPTLDVLRDALPTRAAMVKYIVSGSGLYVVIVRKDTVVMKKLPGGRESILSMIGDYSSLVAMTGSEETGILRPRGDVRKRIEDLSQLLHSLLIDPIEQNLRSMDAIYIRLPNAFKWLPLHTLSRSGSGGRATLTQRFRVSYLPVASALLFASVPERAALQVVGFGHKGSSGWDIEYELADIRSFYEKAPMLFDSMATIERLKRIRADVLALGAVFRIDGMYPARSGILTSGGRTANSFRVTPLGDLADIPVPQTAVISEVSGTPGVLWDYVPLMFLANGTRTVIATMWRGDRKAKKYFGEVFYTASFNGSGGAEAYQRAVIGTATNKEYGTPERWGLYYRFGK